jgi:hypothetical protein
MTSTPDYTPDLEAAAQRVREVSEKLLETSKKNGLAWVETYERILNSMLALEEQAARGSQVDWISTLATTHADFVREVSQAYLGTIRKQLS